MRWITWCVLGLTACVSGRGDVFFENGFRDTFFRRDSGPDCVEASVSLSAVDESTLHPSAILDTRIELSSDLDLLMVSAVLRQDGEMPHPVDVRTERGSTGVRFVATPRSPMPPGSWSWQLEWDTAGPTEVRLCSYALTEEFVVAEPQTAPSSAIVDSGLLLGGSGADAGLLARLLGVGATARELWIEKAAVDGDSVTLEISSVRREAGYPRWPCDAPEAVDTVWLDGRLHGSADMLRLTDDRATLLLHDPIVEADVGPAGLLSAIRIAGTVDVRAMEAAERAEACALADTWMAPCKPCVDDPEGEPACFFLDARGLDGFEQSLLAPADLLGCETAG